MVRRADDPFWNKYYPPWDFSCRCTVVSLDAEEMDEEGLTVATDDQVAERYGNLMPGMGPQLPAVREGFAGNPAEKFFLNKGVAGMPETPEGRAAFEAVSVSV